MCKSSIIQMPFDQQYKFKNNNNSMKSNTKTYFMFLFVLTLATCIYIQIDQQPLCLTLPRSPSSTYKIFYQSISQSPQIFATVKGKHISQIILQGKSNSTNINADQNIQFCLWSKGQGEIQPVSIDFYLEEESGLRQLALKTEVQEIHQQLVEIGLTLREIAHNERFQEQRQAIQTKIIQKYDRKLVICTALKIAFVAIIIFLQLFVIWRKIKVSKIKECFVS